MKRGTRRGIRFLPALTLAALALGLLGAAGEVRGAVASGDFCVVGLGAAGDATPDGWLAIVSPSGAVTPLALPTPLIDPWDCAIDPTTGEVIVVDEGPGGGGADGVVYRISVNGSTVTQTVVASGAPLVNPRGVAVASDGTVFVADVGAALGNPADGAVYAIAPGGSPVRLDTGGVALRNPIDLDLDPRPFTTGTSGVHLIVLENRGGALLRIPLGGGQVTTVAPGPGGRWDGIEVGPFGNYFIASRSIRGVERYDRLSGTRTRIAAGGVLQRPWGITVDYTTADLVVADRAAGVIDVPPNAYLAGAPGPSSIVGPGGLPGPRPVGIGFAPPLPSSSPSANFGVPTRRAPIPGGAFTVIGPSASVANGDVEHALDLFIEVTSVASPLRIHLFDANLRDGYDYDFGTGFATAVTYTLYDPGGAVVTSVTLGPNARVDLDQRIATLGLAGTLTVGGGGIPLPAGTEGLYHLAVVAGGGGDVNAFGVWVEGFRAYTFNAVVGVLNTFGPHPNLTPLDPLRLYPYFERGCEYTESNFDFDANLAPGTAIALTTALGEKFSLTASGQTVHAEDTIDPAPGGGAPASRELDYGAHRLEATLSPSASENNVATLRAADFEGYVDAGGSGPPVPVPPGNPASNPTASLAASPAPAYPQMPFGPASNTFLRHYLPRYDETPAAAAPPRVPYATQAATPLLGDPPTVGAPARYAIQIQVVNPDPTHPLRNVTLTAPVPAPALYVDSGPAVSGGAVASGGGSVTTCSPTPCSGTITASWALVPPASAVTLSYAIEVTASAPGQRLYLTGGPPWRGGGPVPAANPAPTPGTTVSFEPAWSSAAFPRTESLGPLCDLSVVEGTVTPVAVRLARFEALARGTQVWVVWETASEVRHLGFRVLRRLEGESDFRPLPIGLLLGRGGANLSARYAVVDRSLPAGVNAEYLLEDIDLDGRITRHGPVSVRPATPSEARELARSSWDSLRWVGARPKEVRAKGTPAVPPAAGPPGLWPRAPAPSWEGRRAADAPSLPAKAGAPAGGNTRPTAALAPRVAASPAAGPVPETWAAHSTAASTVSDSLALAAAGAIKIALRGPALAALTGAELQAAGLDSAADPARLRAFRRGREIALRVEAGADGRLDPTDRVWLWSDGLDTRYSDEDVIFLIEDAQPGRRVPRLALAPPPGAGTADVAATGLYAEQRIYLPWVRNGEDDNFAAAYVFDRPLTIDLPTPAAAPGGGTLRLRLWGGTSYAAIDPDHHFEIRVGGVPAGEARFDGNETLELAIPLAPGSVGEPATRVEIVPLFDSGAPFDLIYVDRIAIDYRRRLDLVPGDSGRLVFRAEADGSYRVTGLSDPARARVWDVSDPDAPIELAATPAGPGALVFAGLAGERYAITDAGAEAAAAWIARDSPSSWTQGGGADWVAIAPRALLPGARRLAALRQSQGLRTAVVDVEDVYDEQAGGVFAPPALRDFLRAIEASWSPAPRYVVLVGDANYDYRGFLGGGARNLVPTMLVDTPFAEAASDAYFADLDLDGSPDLAIGRLPVRDAAELDALVTKIERYEARARTPAAPGWRSHALLVADDGLGAGDPREAADFGLALDAFTASASPDLRLDRLELADLPEALQGSFARSSITQAIAGGLALLVYVGHGGARIWADEQIFSADDLAALPSDSPLPLVVALNCLNGFFDAPNEESLAEEALRAPDRGAIAFVSSTTVSAFDGEAVFGTAFGRALLRTGAARAGDLFLAAALEAAKNPEGREALPVLVLIGDPATELALPALPRADAGAAAAVARDRPLRLDGSASRAADGSPLAFSWRVASEPAPGAAVLAAADSERPWFVGSVPGSYTIELVVSDGRWRSAPAQVRIDVRGTDRLGLACSPGTGGRHSVTGIDGLYFLLAWLGTWRFGNGRRRRGGSAAAPPGRGGAQGRPSAGLRPG